MTNSFSSKVLLKDPVGINKDLLYLTCWRESSAMISQLIPPPGCISKKLSLFLHASNQLACPEIQLHLSLLKLFAFNVKSFCFNSICIILLTSIKLTLHFIITVCYLIQSIFYCWLVHFKYFHTQ